MAALPLIALCVCRLMGLSLNVTPSIERGVYRDTSRAVRVGEIVSVCPPRSTVFVEARDRGYFTPGRCPELGIGPLLKRVLAAEGDRVGIDAQGVTVNGWRVPKSAPRRHDGAKRDLPQIRFDGVLDAHQILLMGDGSDVSFDGRYFGMAEREWVLSVVTPVFTWK